MRLKCSKVKNNFIKTSRLKIFETTQNNPSLGVLVANIKGVGVSLTP